MNILTGGSQDEMFDEKIGPNGLYVLFSHIHTDMQKRTKHKYNIRIGKVSKKRKDA